jgi:microsomal dipeptidase-like Zn-dependent dipeptidase
MSNAKTPFVVDWHAHFPIKFDPEAKHHRRRVHAFLRSRPRARERLIDRLRFFALEIADRCLNRASLFAGHAVTLETLEEGNVGVVLSVAYNPMDELEIEPWPAPPRKEYFRRLQDLFDRVEDAVHADPKRRARIVRNAAELEGALRDGKIAMVHVVEGGFHMGHADDHVVEHTAALAKRGVAYVTPAHMMWRRVATGSACFPFIPDALYHELFPQDPKIGLDDRGRVLVREMVRHGILVDVAHMSERCMDEVLDLLDRADPGKTVPIIASHIACRTGNVEYNLREPYVKRIAERGGICGLTFSDHFVRSGNGARTRDFEDSLRFIHDQIAKLREWGGDDVVAIGSDLDGFIKPSLAGLTSASDHAKLAAKLTERYGEPLAKKICHDNSLRVLQRGWMKPFDWPAEAI